MRYIKDLINLVAYLGLGTISNTFYRNDNGTMGIAALGSNIVYYLSPISFDYLTQNTNVPNPNDLNSLLNPSAIGFDRQLNKEIAAYRDAPNVHFYERDPGSLDFTLIASSNNSNSAPVSVSRINNEFVYLDSNGNMNKHGPSGTFYYRKPGPFASNTSRIESGPNQSLFVSSNANGNIIEYMVPSGNTPFAFVKKLIPPSSELYFDNSSAINLISDRNNHLFLASKSSIDVQNHLKKYDLTSVPFALIAEENPSILPGDGQSLANINVKVIDAYGKVINGSTVYAQLTGTILQNGGLITNNQVVNAVTGTTSGQDSSYNFVYQAPTVTGTQFIYLEGRM